MSNYKVLLNKLNELEVGECIKFKYDSGIHRQEIKEYELQKINGKIVAK